MSSNFCNVSLKKRKYTKKDGRSLANMGIEIFREHKQEYKNADGTHKTNNEILIDKSAPTLKQSLDKFLDDNNLKVRNSRTVLAYQLIFSIPKEYKDNPKMVEKFKKQTMNFLNTNENFKGNVLCAVYHGDETQPHIQVIAVPMKNGKLAFQEMFGGFPDGADKLSKLQDDFGEAMKPLGLVRGDGTHTNGLSYQQYKKAVKEIARPVGKEVPRVPKVEDTWNPWSKIEQLENQNEALKKQNNILAKEYNKAKFYEAQNIEVKTVNSKLKKKNNKLEMEKMKYDREQTEKLRVIDCREVMEKMGVQPLATDKSKYKTEEFNVVISKDTNKFFDNVSGVGGFGAIDLMTKVFKYTFREAREFLAQNFGFDRTATLITTDKNLTEKVVKEKLEKEVLPLPTPKPNNLPKIYDYLTQKRKIKKELVDELVSKNLLYADSKNNCVFTNEDQTFAFIRGTWEEKRFVGTKGKIDFIKYDFGKSKTNEIYLFESAIDALSYRTLNPNKNGLYVVLNGSALINRVHELGVDGFDKVVCCFDNDEQGKKFCDKIKEQTTSQVVIDKPLNKDFNEDLINGTTKPTNSIDARNQQNATAVARETKSIDADTTEGNQPNRRRLRK